jgi:hypothetical protein
MSSAAVNLVWTAQRVAKRGNAEAECEDAYAGDQETGRFAVADGASESAFAGPWAEAVAAGYVANPGPWSSWLPAARAGWHERFQSESMPWYIESKFQEGAFATLAGLHLCRTRLRWHALAVGDSCVFQLRGDRLRRAFPVKRSADFGSRPALIGSRTPPRSLRCRRLRARGSWRPGDAFLLMTDALAEWFLREVEEGRRPWTMLRSARDAEAYRALLDDLRVARQMRNDDATLLWIGSEPG